MANQEQLEILKAGVEGWNKWRQEHPDVKIELVGANLYKTNLKEADLFGADLSNANLSDTDLSGANLIGTKLFEADLSDAFLVGANLFKANLFVTYLVGANLRGINLSEAFLSEANFREADLSEINLSRSNISRANLTDTNFFRANLKEVDLRESHLKGAYLNEAKLNGAIIGHTTFGNSDLSQTEGLETILHDSPSTIGTDTFKLSKGKLPATFLRGCGLSDWEIESAKLYSPDLTNEEIVKIQYRIYDLRATQAIQISPLFISYSHGDTDFVDHIDSALTEKGVRFWRDIHDAKAGRLETQIDHAIRQNPTVLLVLSKNSLNSDWVQHEVRKARELEKELGRDALCPIALDDSWKSSKWPSRIMEQVTEYNILDFSGWKESSNFESKFAKLLNGLDLFYKKPTT